MTNRELHFIDGKDFQLRINNKEFNLSNKEVLIQVKACGICGSDLSYVNSADKTKKSNIILGHEFVGIVLKIGHEVTNFKGGENVVINPGLNCGICEFCRSGNPNLCQNTKFYGYPPFDGGLQEYTIVHENNCYKLPDNINFKGAVMIEPLAVVLNAINLSKFKCGMDVLIIGAGAIGVCLIKLLKDMHCGKIFVSEPKAYRRKVAESLGADFVFDPIKDNISNIVLKYTEGRGVARVFEASGSDGAIQLAIDAAKIGAQLIIIGIAENDNIICSHSKMRKKGLTLKMVRTIRNTMLQAIDIISKDPGYESFVNFCCNLEELPQNIDEIKNRQTNSIKNAVIFC